MVDEGPGIERELPTVCTPSTVETTVEASRTLTIVEGKKGECEGERRGPPGALEPGWARSLSSRASCQLGRCAYADPAKPANRYLAAVGCDGYHASRSLDTDGRPMIRWGLCPRHREWWRVDRMRRAAGKAAK